MEKYIIEYTAYMLETKSETTVKNHISTLKKFFSIVSVTEPIEVLVKDVRNFRNTMYETKKAGTVNTMLKRLKMFFSWCCQEGYIDVSPAADIKLLTEAEQLPKWISEEQEDILIRSIKKKYLSPSSKKKSYREYAIIMTMLKAGLRVGEVVNLKWDEIQIVNGKGRVLVRGKGQQQRIVPLISDLVFILEQYKKHHGTKGEYVFFSQMSDKITERMIQNIIKEFVCEDIPELHPHMLRHTYAHNLANAGLALEKIARLLGHMKKNGTPNINQTIRYTMASDSEIAEDIELILGTR